MMKRLDKCLESESLSLEQETMIQRLTGAFLLGLMMVVTATSQGALYYCLCLNTVSAGACACGGAGPDGSHLSQDEPEPCHEDHCCHSCGKEAPDRGSPASAEAICGHDCTIKLQLQVNDFCHLPDLGSSFKKDGPVETLTPALETRALFSRNFGNFG